MCPYCYGASTVCDKYHGRRSLEGLGCLLGIPPCRVIICGLHMRERIMERLLIDAYLACPKKATLRKIINSIPELKTFKIQNIRGSKGKLFRCYLTGPMVASLLKHVGMIKEHIHPSYYRMMVLFGLIVMHLNKTSLTKEEKEELRQLISSMQSIQVTLYAENGTQSWYMHILFHHVLDLIDHYESLTFYETQGFEAAHIDDQEIMKHTSNNGGSENYISQMLPTCKDQRLVQFLLYRLRKLMLCAMFKLPFVKRERVTSKYLEFLKLPLPNFPTYDHDFSNLQATNDNVSDNDKIECRGDCIKHFDHTIEGEYRSEGTTNEQNGVNLSKQNTTTSDMFNTLEGLKY